MKSSIDRTTETKVTDLFPKQFIDDFTLYLGLDPDVAPQFQPIDIIDHLKTVVDIVEEDQWRIILPKTVTLRGPLKDLFRYGDRKLYLPYGNVASLTSFTYLDTNGTTQSVSSSNYTLCSEEPSYIWCSNWARYIHADGCNPVALTITYTTGYTTFSEIPQATLKAIKIMAYHLFVNRGAEPVARPMAYDHTVDMNKNRSQRCMENV